MNLAEMVLSERSQRQKAAAYDYMKCPEQANTQRQKVEQQLPWAGGDARKWGGATNECRVSLKSDESVLEFDGGVAARLYEYPKSH